MKSFRFAQFYVAYSLAGLLLSGCQNKQKCPDYTKIKPEPKIILNPPGCPGWTAPEAEIEGPGTDPNIIVSYGPFPAPAWPKHSGEICKAIDWGKDLCWHPAEEK